MEILLASLEAMVFLIGIGLVGFLILAKRLVGKEIVQTLSPLVLDIAVPCLVFSDILAKFEPGRMPEWWFLPLVWLGFTLLTLPMALVAGFLVKQEFRGVFAASLFYPNAVFVPLAVLAGIFGQQSLLITELFLLTLLFPAVLFNTFGLFLGQGSRLGHAWRFRDLLHPVVVATALAIAIRLPGWHEVVPGFVLKIAASLGSLALPLIMLLIGGSIYLDFQNRGKIQVRAAALFVLLKNFAWPGLTLAGIWLFQPPQAIAVLVFLQSAVPPVTAIPVLTARAGGNVSLANQLLIGSFLASVITIPLGLWGLQRLYPGLF